MLGKLLKYDIKSMWKMMIPLILSVLGTTLLGTVALRIATDYQPSGNDPFSAFFMISLIMLIIMSVFALIAFSVITTIFILYRYYKNLFTDEGYLTFTLPVTPDQILLSKVINGILWSAVSLLVLGVCAGCMVVFGAGAGFIDSLRDVMHMLEYTIQTMGLSDWTIWITTGVSVVVSLIQSLLLIYLSITIGSVVAKQHKVIASIGLYLGITFGLSIVTTLIRMIPSLYFGMSSSLSYYSAGWTVHFSNWLNIALSAAIAVGSYLISRSILKNRVNLS